jgi:hypothetical protein
VRRRDARAATDARRGVERAFRIRHSAFEATK